MRANVSLMEFRAELAAVAAAAYDIQGGAGNVQQVETLLASLEHILQASTAYLCDLHTLQGSTSLTTSNCVCHKIWQSMQAGLKGTRTIQSLTDVIQAMACAFPLQLSAALDTAQHDLAAQQAAEALLPRLWMQHAVHDGSLSTLLANLRTQPQVKRQVD